MIFHIVLHTIELSLIVGLLLWVFLSERVSSRATIHNIKLISTWSNLVDKTFDVTHEELEHLKARIELLEENI